MTLTKAILIDALFSKIGLSRREAKDIVEAFFGEISESLSKGQHVKIAGFGRFEVRDKKQRPGRNPRTGELIPIKARRVVIFHASTQVREKLADINYDRRG